MYLPEHFAETRIAELHALITSNPLGALVTSGPDGLYANHVPFELLADQGEHGTLQAHLARANPLVEQIVDGMPVLVIFQGAQAYVSPNWYPSKHETHRQVPTWNYQVVHVHGPIFFQHDDKSKRAIVGHLTKHFETATNGDKAWKMADAPADFMLDMVQNIVGFQINIDTVQAKSKLSQNREMEDYDNVAHELEAKGLNRLASRMRYPKGDPAAGLD